jgi:WD40 repeat protein
LPDGELAILSCCPSLPSGLMLLAQHASGCMCTTEARCGISTPCLQGEAVPYRLLAPCHCLQTRYQIHNCEVSAVDCAADGATIVSGGSDGHIVLWSHVTGFKLVVLTVHSTAIRSLCFNSGEHMRGWPCENASLGLDLRHMWPGGAPRHDLVAQLCTV